MAKAKKVCRICGKEYTPCSYCENDTMAFHYRTICCSTACAKIYLQKVLEARSKSEHIEYNVNEKSKKRKSTKNNSTSQIIEMKNLKDDVVIEKDKSVEKDQKSEVEVEQIDEIEGTLD